MNEYRDISFNPELLKINHYQHYPQMIPFVGKNYKETRLLVIAESHYLPPDNEAHKQQCVYEQAGKDHNPPPTAEDLFNNWYKNPNPIPKIWNGATLKDNVDSFNSGNYAPKENAWCWVDYTWTAKIVAADRWNNKGHKIFKILQKSLKSERLMNCAFMNFFQRPVPKEGASMKDFITPYDIEVAGDTLQKVCEILKPYKIFFASSCAWDNFNFYINKKGLLSVCSDNSWQVIKMKDCFNSAIVGHGSHTNRPKPPAKWYWITPCCAYTRPKNMPKASGKEAFEYFISKDFKF